MNIYTLGTKNKPKLNTNIYIRVSFIKDTNKLFIIANNKMVDTNIKNINTFVNDLVEYEILNNNGRRKETNINYGVCLRVLLDKQHTREELKELTREIAKKYNNLPYFSFISNTGKAYYLNIYLSERYYNEKGIKIIVRAKQDIYRNKQGKACKKNSKGSILYKKKGQIIASKISKFSSKERYFRFNNKGTFIKALNDLKVWYANTCKKIFKTIINNTISFKRYVLYTLSYKEKGIARLWNKALKNMEQDFYKAYNSLTINGTEELDKDIKQKLDNLFIATNNQIKNNYDYNQHKTRELKKFNDGRFKFYIDFKKNYKQSKNECEMLESLFNKRLLAIYESAFNG